MSEPKAGWRQVAFGDVAQLSKARSSNPEADGIERYVGLDHLDPGDLRVHRWGNVAEGTTFTSVFRPGQVLFGKRRAYQRKVAVAEFSGVCSGDIYVFETKDAKTLLPELLPFICQTDSFFDHAVGTSAGSLSPRTNWKSLANFEFALPPLDEQHWFAQALGACEYASERQRELEERIGRFSTALVESELSLAKSSSKLGDLVLDIQYGSSARANSDGRGTPILRIPNVIQGRVDLSEMKWVDLPSSETQRYLVSEGDILAVRTNGNPDYVARCAVVPKLETRTVFASYLVRLRPNPARVSPTFLASVLGAPTVRRILSKSIRSSAGNYNINAKDLGATEVPLPSEGAQVDLIARLERLEHASGYALRRREQLNTVKKGLLSGLLGQREP